MSDVCGDCKRPPWPGNRTARASDCLANETVEGGRECARITVARLRSELASARAQGSGAADQSWESAWQKRNPREHNLLGSAAISKHHARRLSGERSSYRDGYLDATASARAQVELTEAERKALHAAELWRAGEIGSAILKDQIDELLALRAREKAE